MTSQNIDEEREKVSEKIEDFCRQMEVMALTVEFEAVRARLVGLRSVDRLYDAGSPLETCYGRNEKYMECYRDMMTIAEKFRELKEGV